MSTYTINESTLIIPDPEAFGLDCNWLPKNHEFAIVYDKFERDRRTYNIHTLVIKEKSSGRFFATEYSIHEDEGFEWGPGEGRDCATTWSEVFPHEITTIVYKSERP